MLSQPSRHTLGFPSLIATQRKPDAQFFSLSHESPWRPSPGSVLGGVGMGVGVPGGVRPGGVLPGVLGGVVVPDGAGVPDVLPPSWFPHPAARMTNPSVAAEQTK